MSLKNIFSKKTYCSKSHDFVNYWKLNTRVQHCVNCGSLFCHSYSEEDIKKIIYCG